MSKVTITFEDRENGNVMVRCEPSYENMAKALTGGLSKSNAFSMAIACANYLRDRAKAVGAGHKKSSIILPSLKPGKLH